MIRVIETPNFMKRIVYVEELNPDTGFNELKPMMDGDDVVTEDMLIFTIVETFDVTTAINEMDEEYEILTLIEKKRVMPNGDYYVIDGNVELYVPIVKPKLIVTEDEKYKDMVNQLMEAYLASFTI